MEAGALVGLNLREAKTVQAEIALVRPQRSIAFRIYVVGHSPGNAAACFTQVAICASSSSSPSWMSM